MHPLCEYYGSGKEIACTAVLVDMAAFILLGHRADFECFGFIVVAEPDQ